MKISSFLSSTGAFAQEATTAFPFFGTTQMDLSILWGTDQPSVANLKSSNDAFNLKQPIQPFGSLNLPSKIEQQQQATTMFFEFDAWANPTVPSFQEEIQRNPAQKVTSFDFAFGEPTTAPDINIFLKNSQELAVDNYSLGTTAMDFLLNGFYTTAAMPLFETTEANALPVFTTDQSEIMEINTTPATVAKDEVDETLDLGAFEGMYGKKGSEEEFENLESQKLDTFQNQIDALGVTVIPFGGRDDQPPRSKEET
ncbi:Oidioi.mRNA.OKI2018_I69.XSR.g16841.t1.cds [Oikopleura dioica]|uniref:Oidioi.mRNA.OKI2018_I69.XSR.g16841.t1.cds n=1 Tax=Oikopleura dioica TaxID=34765 RepID=A0ABN7SNQ0_OIKDI|nr:Oidioi.mRNA.OKI2018_I69.XSR.g16841.t1.cds [Oikopleura dioica]